MVTGAQKGTWWHYQFVFMGGGCMAVPLLPSNRQVLPPGLSRGSLNFSAWYWIHIAATYLKLLPTLSMVRKCEFFRNLFQQISEWRAHLSFEIQ